MNKQWESLKLPLKLAEADDDDDDDEVISNIFKQQVEDNVVGDVFVVVYPFSGKTNKIFFFFFFFLSAVQI